MLRMIRRKRMVILSVLTIIFAVILSVAQGAGGNLSQDDTKEFENPSDFKTRDTIVVGSIDELELHMSFKHSEHHHDNGALRRYDIDDEVSKPVPREHGEGKKNTPLLSKCDTIHITIVCAGHNASRQVVTLIKSLLFHRKNPLHFHFISDAISHLILNNLFRTWDVPRVDVSFYLAETFQTDVPLFPTRHNAGLYELMTLVLTKILPDDITKTIVLDTGVIFATDIAELWENFSNLNGKKAIGLVENEQNDWHKDTHWANCKPWNSWSRRFNTGVMLFDVEKLRHLNWMQMWRSAVENELKKLPMTFTDKDVINAVIIQHPYLLYPLHCSWNVELSENTRSWRCYTEITDPTDVKVIQWKLPIKQHVKNKHLVFFHYLYLTFLEYSGNLLRRDLFGCPAYKSNNTLQDESKEDDECHEFRREGSLTYITHLFFLDFQYTPKSGGNDVTFVSQLSFDRLRMLEPICTHWKGPISLALYVTESEAQQFLRYALSSDFLIERKDIAFHVVYKTGHSHPLNFLRNVALKHVTTPYVFLSDIDFLPSHGSYKYLRKAVKLLIKKSTDVKKALIVPAFEFLFYRDIEFPRSKENLLHMVDTEKVFNVHDFFSIGHGPTNYTKWRTAKAPYKVQWEPHFEPYMIMKKDGPLYDVKFSGYGGDKSSHTMELCAQGYEFIVLPDAFIVQIPHPPSFDSTKFNSSRLYQLCHEVLLKEFQLDLFKKYGSAWFGNRKRSNLSP